MAALLRTREAVCLALLVVFLGAAGPLRAGDWPMWRNDAGRSAASDEPLPETLHLQWVRECRPLEPAWPHQARQGILAFDVSYKPVVMGKQMFVGSSGNHSLTAFDTDTGAQQWRFYSDGPIRFAPVASDGRVFVGSDDGYMYCLNASDGSVLWKYRPGPGNHRIIGNQRLCGLWPVRGGVVLQDGTLYFGAGIWPFMGTFICALDAKTGTVVWESSGQGADDFRDAMSPGVDGSVRPSIYGCVPQGYFTIAAGRLVVPQGRNLPRVYDLKTGKRLYNDVRGMHPGDSADQWFALAAGNVVLFSRPGADFTLPYWHALDVKTLELVDDNPGSTAVTAQNGIYVFRDYTVPKTIACVELDPPFNDRKSIAVDVQANTPGSYIKAGKNLYLADKAGNLVVIKDVDSEATVVKGPPIPGKEVWDMLAADGKLFTVSRDGKIACFGPNPRPVTTSAPQTAQLKTASQAAAKKLASVTAVDAGYCVVLGLAGGDLTKAVLAATSLNVVVVDASAERIGKLRREVDAAGLYGTRLTAYVSDDLTASGLPTYLASVVTSETLPATALTDAETLRGIYRIVRPYGGKIYLPGKASTGQTVIATVAKSRIAAAEVTVADGYVVVTRKMPPPGAADKTHSNGDAANTMTSPDDLVRPPFGVLWFGGPSNEKILPRHGHGPSPQACRGVLVIEGPNILRAIDIYTGGLLWEREFPGIGKYFNTGGKQLGAHEIGDNYVTTPEGVYAITPEKCLHLDLSTGRTLAEIALPTEIRTGTHWGSIRVDGPALIATIGPTRDGKPAVNGAASQWLAVFDRRSGKALWTRKADYCWGNVAVVAGNGKAFASDKYPIEQAMRDVRRGQPTGKTTLYAFDMLTGKTLWTSEQNVFGAWLAYSKKHDVLIQCGRGSFGPKGEAAGFLAVRGSDGSQIWKTPGQTGPAMLIDDLAVPQRGNVVRIVDGTPATRTNPLTGEQFPWRANAHGCSFNSASTHLIYVRAGGAHAGYVEVDNAFGMNCLNGFRSSCTANATAAGGVLVYPDYTRDCRCQFENQTSLALIHMPEADQWAFDYRPGDMKTTGRIARIGLNCAGPGDRLDERGTLWLDYPGINGPYGPTGDYVNTSTLSRERLRCHPSRLSGQGVAWVLGSALIGEEKITLPLGGEGTYTVRLSFAELDPAVKPTQRVFDVTIQGRKVLSDFDIVKEAKAPHVGLVKTFKTVAVSGDLTIALTPKIGKPLICGIEAFIEPSTGKTSPQEQE